MEGCRQFAAAALTKHMQEMLTKWGFTTVWDLGSNPSDTLPLRRARGRGEVLGPQILLAGGVFPKAASDLSASRDATA